MGATLVAQAIQNWSHVSDRAFRVLVAMAVTAKDTIGRDKNVPPGLYFGGHKALVVVLPRTKGGTEKSALRTVRYAIEELEAFGAIECTGRAYLGDRAVYKLTLGRAPLIEKYVAPGSRNFHNSEDCAIPTGEELHSPTGEDTASPTQEDCATPTKKEPLEEPLKELTQEESIGVSTHVLVVDKSAAVKVPEIPPPRCPEPTCAKGFVLVNQMPARCPRCHPPDNVIPFRRGEAREDKDARPAPARNV